uniref:MATH domain-containing protein n=1 Tax=Timema cristinae TaxID=61476 RepID=A0A7R9D420_TIMCR|nr:unnamed protein product [Timema cristinae]
MSDVSLCALEEKTSSEKELVKSDRNSDSSEKFVRKSIFVAEGVIKLEITDMYNKLSIKTFSESSQPHIFNNTSWTLKFKREFTDDLGVFLLCNEAYQKSTKTFHVEFEIRLINQNTEAKFFSESFNHVFSKMIPSFGNAAFTTLLNLSNEYDEYIKDDIMIIEAHLIFGSVTHSLNASYSLDEAINMEVLHFHKNESLAERAAKFIDTGLGSDCEFMIGVDTPVSIKASKVLLALKEENVINMTDIDPDVFVIMLKYAYRASWKFESKAQAVEVLYAADKYMLDELMQVELFDAMIRWARVSCHNHDLQDNGHTLRFELANIIDHIRFLAMTIKEFSGSPCESGVLTIEEELAPMQLLLLHEARLHLLFKESKLDKTVHGVGRSSLIIRRNTEHEAILTAA